MDDEQTFRPSVPLTWQSLGALAIEALGHVICAVGDGLDNIAIALAAAHNHEIERRAFHEQAAREIETLTGGDFGDGD